MHLLTDVAVVATLLFILALLLGSLLYVESQRHYQTRRVLRESEWRAKLLADNAAGMVLAYDMDGKLLFASPSVERYTAYSRKELQQEGFPGWVHAEDQARMAQHREAPIHNRACPDEEYRLVTKNGQVKWMSATWRPLLDDAGRQVGVQCGEYDISARKRAEQALLESERRFREFLDTVPLAAVMVIQPLHHGPPSCRMAA